MNTVQQTKSYLLTWNPNTWPWKKYSHQQLEVQQNGGTVMQWSCGNSKNIHLGDTFYLMKVGPNKPGIIGKGIVLSNPFKDQHFIDPDREANYIRIRINTLSDNDKPILSLNNLKKEIPDQLWTPQASGITIKDDAVVILERIWYEQCSTSDTDYSLIYGAEKPEAASLEGGRYSVWQTRYERDPEARRKCLELKGYACYVCRFDFMKKYGDLGKEFIHVHHLTQLSTRKEVTHTDHEKDLIPVCPNCHAMLHRGQKTPMSPEELIDIIKINEQNGK